MSTIAVSLPETLGRDVGVSKESQINLEKFIEEISSHFYFPVSRRRVSEEFYSLASTWRDEVKHLSSITEIAMNPSYQKIIGMGEKALPFIFRELERQPDHWFWALNAITGINPVPPQQQGRIKEMAHTWLKWAKESGYKINGFS